MTDDRASDARQQHAFHLILKNCLMAYLLNIKHKINADVLRVISNEITDYDGNCDGNYDYNCDYNYDYNYDYKYDYNTTTVEYETLRQFEPFLSIIITNNHT
ncbi:hypothetical protein BD560DRAFT_444136 [Blakeslea trispora]|nr:hypothetical protein BD560DRAFT_444136 [Blakeslea trispora]